MRRQQPWKKPVFIAIAAAIGLLLVELGAQSLYGLAYGERYSPRQLLSLSPDREAPMLRALEQGDLPRRYRQDVLHPFVGFVRNVDEGDSLGHGFHAIRPIRERSPDALLVAVLGGSVAEQLAAYLEAELRRSPAGRSGREIVVLNFAMGGYKQPQQLLILSYMMSLGAEFDIVLNIDGFNELALSVNENYENGVFPFFPRAWGARVGLEKSSKNFITAGKIKYLRGVQSELADRIRSSPFRHSAVYGSFRRFQMSRLMATIGLAFQDLITLRRSDYDFEKNGPRWAIDDAQGLLESVADHWRKSSLMMERLASSDGAEYYHFLQPNQYLPGSKRLTGEERSLSGYPREAYAAIIPEGYRLLIERGARLRSDDVRFHDATAVFGDTPETIYRDACCHYNDRGNELLAKFVVERVGAATKRF